jgi:hypothetical protein
LAGTTNLQARFDAGAAAAAIFKGRNLDGSSLSVLETVAAF